MYHKPALMLNKKGLSPVVATVLLIMITILSVTVLTTIIVPFIKDSLNKSTKCTNIDSVFTFDEGSEYNCKKIGQDRVNITFSVTRNNDESNVIGFLAIFYEDGTSSAIRIVNNSEVNSEIRMLDASKNNLEIPNFGETRSYVFNASKENYKRAELRTISESGTICEKVSDRIEIPEC